MLQDDTDTADKSGSISSKGNKTGSFKIWQWVLAPVGFLAALEINYQTGIQALITITASAAMLGRTIDTRSFTIDTRSFKSWPVFLLVIIIAVFTDVYLSPELGGSISRLNFNKGVDAMKSEKYEDAVSFFTKAVDHSPKNAQAFLNRGGARLHLREFESAIGDFDRAIEVDPSYALAYANRGSAQSELGRHEQALADCNEAIRLDPRLGLAHLIRSFALQELGRVPEAEIAREEALKLDPQLEQLLEVSIGEYPSDRQTDTMRTKLEQLLEVSIGE